MKHTTFENELRDIRRMAIQELKEALAAHNGKYDFTKIYPPCIKDEMVCEACISDGNVFVYTETTYFIQEEMTVEEILLITEFIPETDSVKDVSGVYPVPVTWVDTDDIEMQGFKTEGMTQKDLQKLAEEMCDIYNNGDFCSDLDLACKNLKLKEKEE